MSDWNAIVVDESGGGGLRRLGEDDLPEGDVTVAVAYSSLNFKDGLAVTGKGKVVRSFPMVCGIDLAGTVESSDSADWKAGDEVVLTGWGLSETHPGGYTQRQRVRSEWLVARPDGLDLRQTMAMGTAGLTGMLCVLALERAGLEPGRRRRGAGHRGGRRGRQRGGGASWPTWATGWRRRRAGPRSTTTSGPSGRRPSSTGPTWPRRRAGPLEKERWLAAVDTVGSETLATVLRQTRYRGAVAACGLAGGSDLPTTVLPFILRNVSLLGVDSVSCPTPVRAEAWKRLASDLPAAGVEAMTTVEPMSRVPELAEDILAGRTRGRVVIDVKG